MIQKYYNSILEQVLHRLERKNTTLFWQNTVMIFP